MELAIFADNEEAIGVVNIASTWRQQMDTADKTTSTVPIVTANAKIQVIKRCEVETSTDSVLAPLVRHLDGAQAAALERFMHARLNDTIAMLRQNARSTAFDGYDPSAWDDGAEPVSCVHSLKDTTGRAAIAPESVTAVAWNCTGAIVAAAYGVLDGADGADWAPRKSVLCAWSITRRSLSASRADTIVELDDSVACLAFHPTEPTLLAGGAFNGDVLLWDVSNDEQPLRLKSTLSDYSHLEPVTRLAWTRPLGRERADLVSLGADGKVLVWRPDEEAHGLRHPVAGFILLAPSAAAAAKAYSTGGAAAGGGASGAASGAIERVHGGTALSFSPEDPSLFVVGVEAGLVLKCSLGSDRRRFAAQPAQPAVRWSADAEALLAARADQPDFIRTKLKVEKAALLAKEREVTLATLYGAGLSASELFGSARVFDYEPHAGVIYEVSHSPFCRHLFLSAATDSAVRLYSMLQGSPLLTVTPTAGTIFCAAWSTSRPMVFAVGAANGRVYVYDLSQLAAAPNGGARAAAGGGAQLRPVEELEASQKAVFSLHFNPRTPELLASGDAEGHVKVWRLGARLSTPQPRERDRLDALALRFSAGADEDETGEEEREPLPAAVEQAAQARRAAAAPPPRTDDDDDF